MGRICAECRQEKTDDAFYERCSDSGRTYLRATCKLCYSARETERYHAQAGDAKVASIIRKFSNLPADLRSQVLARLNATSGD